MVVAPPPRALSVIIPCWNDAAALGGILRQIEQLRGIHEVIVADASVDERCAELAAGAGAVVIRCDRPSRGRQMNAGARAATGEILLFQHADTELRQPHVDALLGFARERHLAGGAFYRKFDARHRRLLWLEPWARRWSALAGSVFGDQSIFVRAEVFREMGGFAEIPLMEDLEFSKRLRQRQGGLVLLDPPIASSPRHAERYGAWKTTVRNAAFIALFHCGVSPHTLHRWYYRLPRASGALRRSDVAVPEVQET